MGGMRPACAQAHRQGARREVALTRVREEALQALWCATVQSLARALEYDYGLCPSAHLADAAGQFHADLQATVRTLFGGIPLDAHACHSTDWPWLRRAGIVGMLGV